MKTTKWFNGSKFVPAHVGVYEVYSKSLGTCYQYWSGRFWSWYCDSVQSAYLHRNGKSYNQNLSWRGMKDKS